jgi:putative transposase
VFVVWFLRELRSLFAGVCSAFEVQLTEFDGEDDHVHPLVNYPPKIAVVVLVNSLEGVAKRLCFNLSEASVDSGRLPLMRE